MHSKANISKIRVILTIFVKYLRAVHKRHQQLGGPVWTFSGQGGSSAADVRAF